MSTHENISRLRKVLDYCGVIDEMALERGLNPYDHAAAIAGLVASLNLKAWVELTAAVNMRRGASAPQAGLPSNDTTALIVAEYRHRAITARRAS
jgi:hypothetical protein